MGVLWIIGRSFSWVWTLLLRNEVHRIWSARNRCNGTRHSHYRAICKTGLINSLPFKKRSMAKGKKLKLIKWLSASYHKMVEFGNAHDLLRAITCPLCFAYLCLELCKIGWDESRPHIDYKFICFCNQYDRLLFCFWRENQQDLIIRNRSDACVYCPHQYLKLN